MNFKIPLWEERINIQLEIVARSMNDENGLTQGDKMSNLR